MNGRTMNNEYMSWEYMSPDEQDRERRMADAAERFLDELREQPRSAPTAREIKFRGQLEFIVGMIDGALEYGSLNVPAARRALVEMLRKELAELAELV